MKRSYQLGALLVVIVVAAWFIRLPVLTGPTARSELTKNLSCARQFAIGCELFAADHAGRFPMHLSELEPDYLPKGTLEALRCVVTAEGKSTGLLVDWLYFGAGFDKVSPPRLLIASPQATTTRAALKRVIIEGDGSGRLIPEAEYQTLLAETVRQMQAEHAKRLANPLPAAASPSATSDSSEQLPEKPPSVAP